MIDEFDNLMQPHPHKKTKKNQPFPIWLGYEKQSCEYQKLFHYN